MNVDVLKVFAFTESVSGGNPAGVVVHSPCLDDSQMKQVSRELEVSETAFVFPSAVADVKVRFFSPTVEVDLCGHATIAAFFTMASQGLFTGRETQTVTQETNVGVLPVSVYYDSNGRLDRVMMTQRKPIYKDIYIDISLIAESLNIDTEDIDDSLPQQSVSTGLYTLPVCVKSIDILRTLHPDRTKITEICTQLEVGSYHVYTFETIEPQSAYHARNFAPLYGITEDPVTGTANGALSSYLVHHHLLKEHKLICEQGDIIGRPGRVFVEIHNDAILVGGKAALGEEKILDV
jgi:PhzF family phenazine biosynthesis protein